MKRRKWLIIILLLLLILGITGWYAYRFILPREMARAIITNKYPKLLPNKYKRPMIKMSDSLNADLEALIVTSRKSGITIEQLLRAVDEAKVEEVRKTFLLLHDSPIKSSEQTFDTIAENIHIQAFDLRLLKNPFVKHVSKKQIKKALVYIHSRNLIYQVDPKLARGFIKQLIIQKQEEIKEKVLKDI